MILDRTRIIDVQSLINSLQSASLDISLRRSNQYSVSSASLAAVFILCIKSALLSAFCILDFPHICANTGTGFKQLPCKRKLFLIFQTGCISDYPEGERKRKPDDQIAALIISHGRRFEMQDDKSFRDINGYFNSNPRLFSPIIHFIFKSSILKSLIFKSTHLQIVKSSNRSIFHG